MSNRKATATLAAGDLLLERGFPDDAASRYYYSMYQAAVHALTERGRRPEQIRSGAVEWDHSMVQNNVGLLRRRPEDRTLYLAMRELRVAADYGSRAVSAERLRRFRPVVSAFVKELAR